MFVLDLLSQEMILGWFRPLKFGTESMKTDKSLRFDSCAKLWARHQNYIQRICARGGDAH